MPDLQEHVAALNEWIEQVREVVVVDSESSDGTVEYIKAHLKHSNVIYIDHPPGLYQSWNTAIGRATSRYTYIATVNDYMPYDTLLRLVTEAKVHSADIVISAPTLVSDSPRMVQKQWPIHRYLELSAIKVPTLLNPVELLVWNSLYLPGTLMGSSASNLYRTKALQEQPFPGNYGHAGDSARAIQSSLTSKWLIVPEGESTFWNHGGGHSGALGRRLRSRLHGLSAELVERACKVGALTVREQQVLCELSGLSVVRAQKDAISSEYKKYRKARLPWLFFPKAWKVRAQKNRIRKELNQAITALLDKLMEEDYELSN